MNTLDQIIDDSKEPLEVKRALAVKMLHNGIAPAQIARLLNVSVQFVSKWKICFEQSGATALRLAYTGGSSFLRDEQRSALLEWIAECGTLSLADLTEHLQTRYGIEYQSKQSLYSLLDEAAMSWHKTEKRNPKGDEHQVLERREEIKKNFWRINPKSSRAK